MAETIFLFTIRFDDRVECVIARLAGIPSKNKIMDVVAPDVAAGVSRTEVFKAANWVTGLELSIQLRFYSIACACTRKEEHPVTISL